MVIGCALQTLLIRSAYSEEARTRCDGFFETFVVPLLGPPVFKPAGEMSAQYAIEALSPTDGSPFRHAQTSIPFETSLSPVNVKASTSRGRASALNHFFAHQTWYRMIFNGFPSSSSVGNPFCPRIVLAVYVDICSFTGIDLARAGMGLKAYFIPRVRSRVTKIPAMDIVTSTINDLGMSLPWKKAILYFSTLPTEVSIQPVIAAER